MDETGGIQVAVHVTDAVGKELEDQLELAAFESWDPNIVAMCCRVAHGISPNGDVVELALRAVRLL